MRAHLDLLNIDCATLPSFSTFGPRVLRMYRTPQNSEHALEHLIGVTRELLERDFVQSSYILLDDLNSTTNG
jgi:hypothetical protein